MKRISSFHISILSKGIGPSRKPAIDPLKLEKKPILHIIHGQTHLAVIVLQAYMRTIDIQALFSNFQIIL